MKVVKGTLVYSEEQQCPFCGKRDIELTTSYSSKFDKNKRYGFNCQNCWALFVYMINTKTGWCSSRALNCIPEHNQGYEPSPLGQGYLFEMPRVHKYASPRSS